MIATEHLLGKAIRIASEAFEGIMDKGDNPYILHCLSVMNSVAHLGHDAMIVAVLHDLLEDCPQWDAKTLYDKGFTDVHVSRIVILTKKKDEDYMDYIKRCARDPITKACKKGDLRSNMDTTRLKGLNEKDFKRMEKYQIAYVYLS